MNLGFQITDAPSEADINRCVHCGLCLNHCPTYRLTGLETESPRGRLFLIRQLAEGNQDVNDDFIEHTGLCLGCRNCETVCPSSVRFGHLLEAARAEIVERKRLGLVDRGIRWLVFKQIWIHPTRLNALVMLARFYQWSGLQSVVRSTGVLKLFGRFGDMEALLPERKLRRFKLHSNATILPLNKGEDRGGGVETAERSSASLFTGCIMRAGFGDIHDATIRVMQRNGWRVGAPDAQICCGALHLHAGERELAKEMARKNIDAFFSPSPVHGDSSPPSSQILSVANGGAEQGRTVRWINPVIVNAAGCGAVLKEYGELLQGDPAYAERAKQFSARVLDVSEALAKSPLQEMKSEKKLRVTYQEPCHLAHGQRVKKEPRSVLDQISGIEFVEMQASDRCCGSAGIYNVQHPEIANQLTDEKMADIAATGADLVVTGNIGCLLQLEYGKVRSGWKGRVMHLVELLDETYISL